MINDRSAYLVAAVLMVGTAAMIVLGAGALGIVGEEGDSFDRWYAAVIAVGILGALVTRFRALGMAMTAFAMAFTLLVIAVVALIEGKHNSPVSSVQEILGLTAFFAMPLVLSGSLFRHAARLRLMGARQPN